KAELRGAFGVKLLLVMEGDWFEREDNFTGLIHRPNRVFEPLRGNDCSEVTVGVDDYPYPSRHSYSANARDKCGRLSSYPADANCLGLASNTFVAYIDIVIACGEAEACIIAQRDVERTGCVVQHRILTVGCVVAPCRVGTERALTAGGVVVASCVAIKCLKP